MESNHPPCPCGNNDGQPCTLAGCPYTQPTALDFQSRVGEWMLECFGAIVSADHAERAHRFLEEALELVQSIGCTRAEAAQLVDYVFSRPCGEPNQEVGGVELTLSALCNAIGLSKLESGETELARVNQPHVIHNIRQKQATKPHRSPLPGLSPAATAPALEPDKVERALADIIDVLRREIAYGDRDSARVKFEELDRYFKQSVLGVSALPSPTPASLMTSVMLGTCVVVIPPVYQVGDIVEKCTGDYRAKGQIRGMFAMKSGQVRYVVEHQAEGGGSFCHIYSEANLLLLERAPRLEDCGEPAVYTVGNNTMAKVFRPAGLTNLSDLQTFLNAVERALTPPPSSNLEGAADA